MYDTFMTLIKRETYIKKYLENCKFLLDYLIFFSFRKKMYTYIKIKIFCKIR